MRLSSANIFVIIDKLLPSTLLPTNLYFHSLLFISNSGIIVGLKLALFSKSLILTDSSPSSFVPISISSSNSEKQNMVLSFKEYLCHAPCALCLYFFALEGRFETVGCPRVRIVFNREESNLDL